MTQPDPRRSGLRTATVLLGLVGLLWLGQGIGLIPGSFMTGDPTWAWIGGGLLGVSVVMGVRTGR